MARIKKKDHEKLDGPNIEHAIQLLGRSTPITKKAACEILNISYNTKRLGAILEQYTERKAYEKKARARNRGKPISETEEKYIVLGYIKGSSLTAIADSLYRSTAIIKKTLEKYRIPQRDASNDYWHPMIIPDEAVSETYDKEELVWSARYGCVAEIMSERPDAFGVWLYGKHNEFAYQPFWELGKLDVLKKFKLTRDDVKANELDG
jgi:hypothetical protein